MNTTRLCFGVSMALVGCIIMGNPIYKTEGLMIVLTGSIILSLIDDK